MQAYCLQYVPYEGLGSIGAWLKNAVWEITVTRLYEDKTLPVPVNTSRIYV